MKVVQTKVLNENLSLSIVEVDDALAVEHFTNRFQLILNAYGKRIFPKNKHKFLEFEEINYIYTLKSDKTDENVRINEIIFHELVLCDRELNDCELEMEDLCELFTQVRLEDFTNVLHINF